jgi:hypothetical protein
MLENLNQLALEAKNKSNEYDKTEFILSDKFKLKFNELLPDFGIVFHSYTSVVTTSTKLLIILPNQWFVLASFFNGYISALKEYKSKVNELKIDKSIISSIRETKIIDKSTEIKIRANFKDVEEADNFRRFLTDYEWWFGSKTIDRADYFVSSVLNLASVINNSQAYIADLAYILSNHQDLIEIIEEDYSLHLEKISTQQVIISHKTLRQIIFESFKYILNQFGEEKVLVGNEIKETLIEDRSYKGLLLDKYFGFETFVGLFDLDQSPNNLKSSGTPRFMNDKITILGNENTYFTSQWNGVDNGRGLTLENFNKLLFDVSNNKIKIIKQDGIYKLIKISLNNLKSSPISKSQNIIYYGSPGTGKSHKVEEELKKNDSHFYERITFHPEFDNASFVGGYKPVSERIDDKDEIKYKFIPQSFTNIYVKAWNDLENQYYLAIEEINRGNCAEIFGDIFQLLDRKSNYTVSASNELKEHLNNSLTNKDGINNGLKLPSNLTILATMNTSDQSLFPMDSAFKRRWDWEYIPICYEEITEDGRNNESYNYKVNIDDNHYFHWIEFIKKVNIRIKSNPNLGMDKCIGNYFIKSNSNEIIVNEFINKVVFYLWNDVFKDEDSADSIFENGISYEDFFPINTNGKEEVLKILKSLEIGITTKVIV